MDAQTLQARVEALEREVAQLRSLIRAKDGNDEFRERLDRMVDPGVAEIMQAAVVEREKDRRRSRKK